MKIIELTLSLSSEDILSFFDLQKKIQITNVIIDKHITILGKYKITGIHVSFESTLKITKVTSNTIYVNISTFKLLKVNLMNPLSKKALNYVINAFSDIHGISFEGENFKLNVPKIINKYYKSQEIMDLNTVIINEAVTNKNEIQLSFSNIAINIDEYKKASSLKS